MGKRTATTTAVTGILGATLLVAGCGGATASHSESPNNAENGGKNVATAGGGAGATDIGTSNCSEADFINTAQPVEGDPGNFLLTIGNRSDKTCSINGGTPNVAGLDMTNSPIEELPVETVGLPAPGEFTLAPGESVYASLSVTLGDKNDPNSYVVSGFQASLPDMSEPQPVNIVGAEYVAMPATALNVSYLVNDPDMLR